MSPILKIKENTQTLICGKAGSGKTNMLMNYIILHDGIFDNIYVCSDSPDEPLYELLKSYGDNIKVLRPDSFPEIDEFEYTSSHNSPKYLIVFDCVNTTNKNNHRKIASYICDGRGKNMTIMYLSHIYSGTEVLFRQLDNLILLSDLCKRDIRAICSDYVPEFHPNKDNFKSLDFIKIDSYRLYTCHELNSILTKQFLEYINSEKNKLSNI